MKINWLKISFVGSLLSFAAGKAAYISERNIFVNDRNSDLENALEKSEILASQNALNDLLMSLIDDERYKIAEEEEIKAAHPASFRPCEK